MQNRLAHRVFTDSKLKYRYSADVRLLTENLANQQMSLNKTEEPAEAYLVLPAGRLPTFPITTRKRASWWSPAMATSSAAPRPPSAAC